MRIFGQTAIAALALTTLAFAQTTKPVTVDSKVLRSAGSAANDPLPGSWLSYGRNQSETRYSPLKQINDTNAKRLGLAWTYVVGAGGGNQEGTPLVWNNTLYGITTWSVVYALDASTGKELWRWDPEVNQTAVRPKICCGIVNRGMALYNGTIIAPVIDGRLVALDALTGKPVWESRVAYPQDWYTLTMAPRIAGGKVIIGASGGDKCDARLLRCVRRRNRASAWRFYTVPGNPEMPPENEAMKAALKTWGGDFWTKGGGGAVWDGFAYDPEANLVYVGTGNAEPWDQKFRGAQNVDNLYTCSILAVDLTTGQLKWHFQTTPNDNWDFDSVQQLMLLDLTHQRQAAQGDHAGLEERLLLGAGPRHGRVHLRRSLREDQMGAGLDAKGRPIVNPEAYYDTDPISLFPTGGGAHNWSPMSYSPATGWVYIPVFLQPFTYAATDELKPGSNGYTRGSGRPEADRKSGHRSAHRRRHARRACRLGSR